MMLHALQLLLQGKTFINALLKETWEDQTMTATKGLHWQKLMLKSKAIKKNLHNQLLKLEGNLTLKIKTYKLKSQKLTTERYIKPKKSSHYSVPDCDSMSVTGKKLLHIQKTGNFLKNKSYIRI